MRGVLTFVIIDEAMPALGAAMTLLGESTCGQPGHIAVLRQCPHFPVAIR
jgi:hypothetical protein